MTHDSDDRDRDDRSERRRLRRARRRAADREYRTSKDVSVLGVVALVIGIFALVFSVVPCVGMFAIFVAGFALALGVASIFVARHARQGMGYPAAATVVSGTAVVFSLLWLALFNAVFRGGDDRAAVRPAPPPVVRPAPPFPKPPEVNEKQLLDNLAKDRIKEAIRYGPGVPVTAEKLEADYRANAVAAEARYTDKVLEVTGTVVRVVHDDGKPHYTLELATGAAAASVNCDFTEQKKYPLARVEGGQTATVRGLCTGRAGGFVRLTDCVLVK